MQLPPAIYIEIPINTVEANKRGFTILGAKISIAAYSERLIKIIPNYRSMSLKIVKDWRGFPVTLEQLSVISMLPTYESIYVYLFALGHDFKYPQTYR